MKQKFSVAPADGKGIGVFAEKPFKKGDLVVRGKPEGVVGERTDYSFQVGVNVHVQLDEPARLINHSCEPNLGVRNNKHGGYDFIVVRDIDVGEELTWDYSMTEFVSIAIKDECLCQSNNCRKKIGGFVCLPVDVRNKYNEFIADYLKRL